MASYRKYNVNLTEGQKEKLRKYFQKRAPMTLRLSHNQLSGGDQLLLTNTQIRKIEKSKIDGTGTDISRFRLTKKQQEGGFLGTLSASIGIPLIINALTGKG